MDKKTSKPAAWSEQEVADTIESYFTMLRLEKQEIPYNKAKHRRELKEKLNNRSEGSIEMKHMNISAILESMGERTIKGYKPLKNYQQSLYKAVLDYRNNSPEWKEQKIKSEKLRINIAAHSLYFPQS